MSLISKWSILSALSSAIRTRKDSKSPVPYEDVEADVMERADRLEEAERLLTEEGTSDPTSLPTYDELDKELFTELSKRLLESGRLRRGISFDEGEAKYLIESLEKKYLDFAEKARRQDYRTVKQELFDIIDSAITKSETEYEGLEVEEEKPPEQEQIEPKDEDEESLPPYLEPEKSTSDTLFADLPKDVLTLAKRLKNAEKRVLQAADMIKHLGTVKGITEKIKCMQPYALESEGAEVRKKLWLLEKRIIRLERRRRATEQLEDLEKFEERWAKQGMEENPTLEPPLLAGPLPETVTQTPAKEGILDLRHAIMKAREKMAQAHATYNEFSRRLAQIKEGIELDTLCFCSKEISNMKSALNALTGGQFEAGDEIEYVPNRRLDTCGRKFDNMCDKIKAIGNLPEIIDIARKYMVEVKKYVDILQKKIDEGDPLRVVLEDNRSILYKLLYKLRYAERHGEIEVALTNLLYDEEILRDMKLLNMTESIELLNISKINKKDLEDALNEKVDRSELAYKVWRDELLAKVDVFKYIIEENTNTFEQHEQFRSDRARRFTELLQTKVHIDDLLRFQKSVNTLFKEVGKEILSIPRVPNPIQAAATKKFVGNEKEKCLICCKCEVLIRPKVFTTPGMTPYHAYELEGVLNKQAHFSANFDRETYAHGFSKKNKSIMVYKESKGFRSKKGSFRNCGGLHTKTTADQRLLRTMPCIPCPFDEICTCPQWPHLQKVSDVKGILDEIIDKNIDPHHFEDSKFMKSFVNAVADKSAKEADALEIQDMVFGKVFKKLL